MRHRRILGIVGWFFVMQFSLKSMSVGRHGGITQLGPFASAPSCIAMQTWIRETLQTSYALAISPCWNSEE